MASSLACEREAPLAPRRIDFWVLQTVGWLMVAWLAVGQCFAALSWDRAVAWGLQEGAEEITEVGVAFSYGFAFGDLIFYTPLLAAGLVGHWRGTSWGAALLAAALGITAYWPIVSLAAVVSARGAPGWALAGESAYWIVLTPVIAWAAWGLWRLARAH